MHLDETGKVSLDHVYTQPDPRDYFTTLRTLEYRIPQLAKPHFLALIREYRAARQIRGTTVLDIGCSYGINAALLKCDTTMDHLYRHYAGPEVRALDRTALLARDHELVRSSDHHDGARFIGLDNSQAALSYGLAAGFLDDALHADLELRDPTERETAQLAGTDVVISTGCLGYVGERTIARIVAAIGDRRPWMAHFILRMFPFDPIADCLTEYGYETERIEGLFKQRRFASPEEQALVLETLADTGVDSRGREADGWLYAQLYVSRPRAGR